MSLKKDRKARAYAAVAFGALVLLPAIVPINKELERRAAAGIDAGQRREVVDRQSRKHVIVIGVDGEPYRISTDFIPAAAVTPSRSAAGLFKGE